MNDIIIRQPCFEVINNFATISYAPSKMRGKLYSIASFSLRVEIVYAVNFVIFKNVISMTRLK